MCFVVFHRKLRLECDCFYSSQRCFPRRFDTHIPASGVKDKKQAHPPGITDLKMDGYSNLYISGITGHLNSAEIEIYTHNPDVNALRHVLEKSRRL
jgi:hypothetical protein